MMKTQLVIGLLSLACVQGLFLSDALYTCCGPDDVWEADEGYLIGSTADGGTVTKGGGRLSYDSTNQMVNIVAESTTNGTTYKYRILQHFQQKMQYTILPNGTCSNSTIAYDFIPTCVPANATRMTSSYYGSPDRPYKIDVYLTELLGQVAYLTVNPDPKNGNVCMFIAEIFYGQSEGANQMENIGFVNYMKGLKNSTVFDVPKECKQGPQQQADIQINRLRRTVFA